MPFWSFLPKLVLIVLLFVIFVRQLQVKTNAIVNLATTCFGVIYISVPLSMILSIVFFHPGEGYEGRWWFLYVLLVTKFSDIGGLFVGSVFGKHKLAAHISPGKTVEGFVGGVICSFCVSLVLWTWWGQSLHFLRMSGLEAVILGLLLPCIGQIGDLAESLLKRDANVKDSNSLPGMGGVLDMVDSLLFTIPTVYVFLKL
jgi:phosphatidate cytidylyltransferase